MTRIDRYLLFLYFRVLLICYTSLTGLLIVVQVFSSLDEFARSAQKEKTSLLAVLVDFFGPNALATFERLSGLFALLALLFVIAWLYRTNEFTALMAAGVTKWRVIRPLLFASAFVIFGASTLREFVIPNFQEKLDRSPQDLTGEVNRPVRPNWDNRAGVLIGGAHLLPVPRQIVSPLLQIHSTPLQASFGRQISGELAQYQEGNGGRPTGFLVQRVSRPRNIDSVDSAYALDGGPLLLTHKDTDWLEPGSCFLVSEVQFEKMRGGAGWKQFVSTSEMIMHLRMGTSGSDNDLRTQIHQRILRPFADWTLLLLAIPVLLGRADRHVFVVAGSCLFLVAGVSGIIMGLAWIAASSALIDPVDASWLPLLVFLPIGWTRTANAMNS